MKRERSYRIRLSDEEYDTMAAASARAGYTNTSDFVRALCCAPADGTRTVAAAPTTKFDGTAFDAAFAELMDD